MHEEMSVGSLEKFTKHLQDIMKLFKLHKY